MAEMKEAGVGFTTVADAIERLGRLYPNVKAD
jgi:hypothetical protein